MIPRGSKKDAASIKTDTRGQPKRPWHRKAKNANKTDVFAKRVVRTTSPSRKSKLEGRKASLSTETQAGDKARSRRRVCQLRRKLVTKRGAGGEFVNRDASRRQDAELESELSIEKQVGNKTQSRGRVCQPRHKLVTKCGAGE